MIECTLDCSFRLHEINNKIVTPFEINDSYDTPFVDIDSNYQYYTNLHHNGKPNCDYYCEDKFRCKLDKIDESQLSLFHLNVKSISKHYELYLNSLDFRVSFIGLLEIWFDDNKKNFMISKVIPVSIDIEKIRRVVVSHFISEKILLLYWEMTLTILTAKWKLFLLKLINVSLTQMRTLSSE